MSKVHQKLDFGILSALRSHGYKALMVVGCWVIFFAMPGSSAQSQVPQPQSIQQIPSQSNPARPGISILERRDATNSSTLTPTPTGPKVPTQPTQILPKTQSPEAVSADAGEELDSLITTMVLGAIPHTFKEDKDWGGQDERWDGIKFRREGLRIKTNRRKKMVNHGTWKKYSAQLLNPEEEFSIAVKNMRETKDEKVAFDVHFSAHLAIDGRQSKWVKGVQLYSFSAQGHTKVRLVVGVELGVSMDINNFPPDLVFFPVAKQANLIVDEFRIDRVSKAGGEFAQQVSKSVRKSLDEKLAKKEAKLVEKINKEFAKNQSKLRLSVAEALKSKWTKPAQAFMPAAVREALEQE